MTSNKHISAIVFLSALFLFLTLGTTIMHGADTLEYLISALRISFTSFFVFLLRCQRAFNIFKKLIFLILLFNSALIIVSFALDFFLSFGIQNAIRKITNEPLEFLRFSGIFGSFQLPAFLFSIVLLTSRPPKYFLIANTFAGIFLSRSLFFANLIILFWRHPKFLIFTAAFIGVGMLYGIGSGSAFAEIFSQYFHDRLIPIFMGADYSVIENSSFYKRMYISPNFLELLFGTEIERFSLKGGGDPFYTRWFVGVGLYGLILLEMIKIIIAWGLSRDNDAAAIFIFLFFAFVDLKGDMVTTLVPLTFFLLLIKFDRGKP